MNKNSLGLKLLCFAFFGCIALYWICGFTVGKYADNSNHEKREMASMPSFSMGKYESFPRDIDKFVNDNLPFRNNLVSLNSMIDYSIFDTSYSRDVIIGDDNWLFYNRLDDRNPLGNYLGLDLLSTEELKQMAENLNDLRDEYAPAGSEFIFMIVPNKSRIYSKYMPKRYGKPAEFYRALQFSEYMKKNSDIKVIYLYDELMKAKSKVAQDIYYKTDEHWNMIGGYVGASVLLNELGIEMPPVDSESIKIKQNGFIEGDMAEILNMTEKFKECTPYYEVSGYNVNDAKIIEDDFYGMTSYRAEGADERILYLIRDSYGSGMIPVVGSKFDESYFRHYGSFHKEEIEEISPDIVVLEFVERNLSIINEM